MAEFGDFIDYVQAELPLRPILNPIPGSQAVLTYKAGPARLLDAVAVGTNEAIARAAGDIDGIALAASQVLGRGASGDIRAVDFTEVGEPIPAALKRRSVVLWHGFPVNGREYLRWAPTHEGWRVKRLWGWTADNQIEVNARWCNESTPGSRNSMASGTITLNAAGTNPVTSSPDFSMWDTVGGQRRLLFIRFVNAVGFPSECLIQADVEYDP